MNFTPQHPRFRRLFVILFVTPLLIYAKSVEIADTGYRLEVPNDFSVHRPAGAPDILLQADRPDGNGTVQVVRDQAQGDANQMAAAYEGKMRQALGNLDQQQENMRTVAGRSCLFRRYLSNSGGMRIRVQALFYADGNQGFVIHSIDTADVAPEFERTVVSLQAPAPAPAAAPPTMPRFGAIAVNASQVGRTAIGETGYSFEAPVGWQSLPASQSPGMQFALPDHGAVMELTWLDVSGQVTDPAAFLDQTIAQVEQGFGSGWQQRERTPHRNGNTNVLFKRFGGQLGGAPAELMVMAVTDSNNLVLAYGYFAEQNPNNAGSAMRQAILSIKRGAASGNATGATVAANPASGWGTPPPPLPSSSGNVGSVPPPPVARSIPPPPVAPTRAVLPPPPAASNRPSAGYQSLVIDDSGFEFAYPAHFTVSQRNEGQTQWADPNASGARIVMVIQSMMRSVGNTVDSVRDDLLAQVQNSSAAQLQSSSGAVLNGLKSHLFHFTLDRGGESQHFRFVVLDLPGPNVATVSFVAPPSLSATAETHYNEVLRTVRATSAAPQAPASPPATSRRQLSSQSSPTPPPPTPSPGRNSGTAAEPATSEEAYFALAHAVQANRWDWVVAHMTEKALLALCERSRNALPSADYTEADAQRNPGRVARDYLNYGAPKQDLAGYFQNNRSITGVRAENADWHLVMTRKATGGEHYLWFKRINGIWQFDY